MGSGVSDHGGMVSPVDFVYCICGCRIGGMREKFFELGTDVGADLIIDNRSLNRSRGCSFRQHDAVQGRDRERLRRGFKIYYLPSFAKANPRSMAF